MPGVAPWRGELFSECLGVFNTGCDRQWRRARRARDGAAATSDGIERWGLGVPGPGDLLRDLLVTADVNASDFTPVGAAFLARFDADAGANALLDRLARMGEMDARAAVESLQGGNVAWEHFQADRAVTALRAEVLGGRRFFKYRHLDEVDIARRWNEEFADYGFLPTLVLGHTHEPRIQPMFRDVDGGDAFPQMLNSGAAGRYEGLLWAIEIDDGVAELVVWTSIDSATPQRRVVHAAPGTGRDHVLVTDPEPRHIPLRLQEPRNRGAPSPEARAPVAASAEREHRPGAHGRAQSPAIEGRPARKPERP
jgi:hypothetical protein